MLWFILVAESHVDRSTDDPKRFFESNIGGTFELLEAMRSYWGGLPKEVNERFRFLHVSTDEVFGSLVKGAPSFSEATRYDPHSPYSATKAGADHLVPRAATFGLSLF